MHAGRRRHDDPRTADGGGVRPIPTSRPHLADAAHPSYVGGRDLRHHPLRLRRAVLEEMIDGHQRVLPARRLPAHGLQAWEEVQRRGYEGLVAKDESSAYLGGRTRSWLKVKQRSVY